MNLSSGHLLRLLIAIVLFFAMVASGFAHRGAATDPDLVAYLQAGGSPGELCDAGLQPLGPDCEACSLAGAGSLPPQTPEGSLVRRARRTLWPDHQAWLGTNDPNPACPARGPPVA